jgi:hypothetical protein
VDPGVRTALLAGGLVFLGLFTVMTVAVAIEFGVDIFTFTAALIILMLALPLIGALRNPPE